jgi:hypothetical protein
MNRNFKGRIDSLYKKWELYLIRLYQLSKYVENQIKFRRISGPEIESVLSKSGCETYIVIPPNPFTIREEDEDVFLMFFDYFHANGDSDKDMRKLHREIWERIGIIKDFLGITKFTRYIGEEQAEKRLCNEIDVYMKYPQSVTPLHRIILGDHTDTDKLYQFKRFLTDRRKIKSVVSYQQYA